MDNQMNEPGLRCTAHRAQSVGTAKRDNRNDKKINPQLQAAQIMFESELGPCTFTIKGRDLWALRELVKAGRYGLTAIERPAPRWSAYIFNLRALGLNIETVHEPHGGPYPGTHGRYVLRSPVAIQGGTYARS